MSNIKEIGAELEFNGVVAPSILEDGTESTEWLNCWKNSERVKIVLHFDVLNYIKANPNATNLSYKTAIKTPKGGGAKYTQHIIFMYSQSQNTVSLW
jgi:hypothetical protein